MTPSMDNDLGSLGRSKADTIVTPAARSPSPPPSPPASQTTDHQSPSCQKPADTGETVPVSIDETPSRPSDSNVLVSAMTDTSETAHLSPAHRRTRPVHLDPQPVKRSVRDGSLLNGKGAAKARRLRSPDRSPQPLRVEQGSLTTSRKGEEASLKVCRIHQDDGSQPAHGHEEYAQEQEQERVHEQEQVHEQVQGQGQEQVQEQLQEQLHERLQMGLTNRISSLNACHSTGFD
ncbi:hypothetical protein CAUPRSCDRAFT_12150 [Caulochytrium protostelioides]|uniref:Uncharacterized protein n=1 Tax=Caulochytrium protostelioides TaxID=1555241 RepID=A0A4P9WV28_9FUNG|nr:hypothetical protein CAUPRSCDRAFT_12150 [Caulochytrium protostelioides]